MSEERTEQKEILREEVVCEETTTELVESEAKKAKMIAIAKKVGKVAAVVGVGVLGFILGTKVSSASEYDCSEIIETVVDSADV